MPLFAIDLSAGGQELQCVLSLSKAALDDERKSKEKQKVTPHFWNLNEDPSLTGMITHFTPPGMGCVLCTLQHGYLVSVYVLQSDILLLCNKILPFHREDTNW